MYVYYIIFLIYCRQPASDKLGQAQQITTGQFCAGNQKEHPRVAFRSVNGVKKCVK